MKRINWQVLLGLSLIALSAILYFAHYLIFRDAHHIFVFLLSDIAFVPFEVLLVTLIIHRLLTYREKRATINKLNMVIGAFFSEVGNNLLKDFAGYDTSFEKIRTKLIFNNAWSQKDFTQAIRLSRDYNYKVDSTKGNLADLRSFLVQKRNFLLRLLENPLLLEHESFTELLWAVFHLTEELEKRTDFSKLPETDYAHLSGDISRAYSLLVSQWLAYMKHLKTDYPYLFSLAVRTNPFDPNAKAEVYS